MPSIGYPKALKTFVDDFLSAYTLHNTTSEIVSFNDILAQQTTAQATVTAPAPTSAPDNEALSFWNITINVAYQPSFNSQVTLTWTANGTLNYMEPFVDSAILNYSLVGDILTYSYGGRYIRLYPDGSITYQTNGGSEQSITLT